MSESEDTEYNLFSRAAGEPAGAARPVVALPHHMYRVATHADGDNTVGTVTVGLY